MRYSKFLTILFCSLILFTGCNVSSTDLEPIEFDSQYFAENMAIMNEGIRSIDNYNFVKDINIKDFNGRAKIPKIYGYKGEVYVDDGSYNDLCEGDGIFTSINSFSHSVDIPYMSENLRRILINDVAIGEKFVYEKELESAMENSRYKNSYLKVAKIKCKLRWASCDEYDSWWRSCPACLFNAGCIEPFDCEGEIGI